MNRDVLLAQLRATHATLAAAGAQVEAAMIALGGDEIDEAAICPQCKKEPLESFRTLGSEAGHFCQSCGYVQEVTKAEG